MLTDDLEELRMERGVAGEELALAYVERLAAEPGHDATALLDDQRPRRHVPRLEQILPEAVEAPSRDVAEVQRRGPQPAHRPRPPHEGAEQRQHRLAGAVDVVVEARAEERIDQRVR